MNKNDNIPKATTTEAKNRKKECALNNLSNTAVINTAIDLEQTVGAFSPLATGLTKACP